MTTNIREMSQDDLEAASNICFSAFGNIANAHNFPLDFPTLDSARGLTRALFASPQVYSVVAEGDGKLIGSNHLWEFDAIRAVGPISVDTTAQAKGAGRQLMQAVIERGSGSRGIRLVQDSFNAASLSLYTSLGFDVREPLVLIGGVVTGDLPANVEVRPMEQSDFEAAADLCQRVHGFDRMNELTFSQHMFTAFVAVRDSRVVAYSSSPHFWALNHAVAESEEDMKSLLTGVGVLSGELPLSLLLPIRQSSLYRWCLTKGMRVVKPMNLMTMGEYHEPKSSYLPSVAY